MVVERVKAGKDALPPPSCHPVLSDERCSHVQELILRLRVITARKKVNKEGRGAGRSKT